MPCTAKKYEKNRPELEVDGIRVCHLGDLGHPLSDKQVADVGKVDILLIPVGGNYTIDAKVASEVCAKLSPKVIVPMHYQMPGLNSESFSKLQPVEPFILFSKALI